MTGCSGGTRWLRGKKKTIGSHMVCSIKTRDHWLHEHEVRLRDSQNTGGCEFCEGEASVKC